MDKLAIPDDGCGDWENEVEEGMGYTLQGWGCAHWPL